MRNANLIDKLTSRLPVSARRALDMLKRLAEEQHLTLHLVGGPVRDLVLGAATLDLDLAVEGDALSLASQVAAALNARCVQHRAFGTATVKGEGSSLDLATVRSESYQHPGALPRVYPASIREDMLRRDFTINAMALSLTGPQRGELFDPCGGQADLKAGLVRVLHEGSFVDDATRILRAVRYEVRFGFQLEERTLAWLKRDVGYLQSISGARLRQEIARILEEAEPERILLRLQKLEALAAVHPLLSFDDRQAQALAALRRLMPEAVPAAYWPLLAWGLDEGEAAALTGRLALTRAQSQAVCAMPRLRGREEALSKPQLKPSQVAGILSAYPAAAVEALAATAPATVRERCLDYLRHGRHARTALDGSDLLELGVPPGPGMREVLQRLKVARLDGEVTSRREEEQMVRSLLASGICGRSS